MLENLKILLYELENNSDINLKENKEEIIFSLKTAIEILDKIRRG